MLRAQTLTEYAMEVGHRNAGYKVFHVAFFYYIGLIFPCHLCISLTYTEGCLIIYSIIICGNIMQVDFLFVINCS